VSNYSTVNLVDASFFSTLAYAPLNMNAIDYGFQQGVLNGSGDVNGMAAKALDATGWADLTRVLLNTLNTSTDPNTNYQFWDIPIASESNEEYFPNGFASALAGYGSNGASFQEPNQNDDLIAGIGAQRTIGNPPACRGRIEQNPARA
jgi:hypothetical protein